MAPASLAEVIAAEKEQLLKSWRQRVRGTIDPAGSDTAELVDDVPFFIDEVVAFLRQRAAPAAVDKAGQVAVSHGSQRFHAGFSLGAVIREYGVLRECILDLLRHRALPLDLDELQAVLNLLSVAIAHAAEEFERQRDRVIENQNQEYFGFIAHELRNPLASALLAAQVLQRRLGTEHDVLMHRLVRNLSSLRHEIDNSLIRVRMRELGQSRPPELTEVSLRKMVDTALEELRGDAEEKEIPVRVEGDATLRADPRLLMSAIANLLRNAVKYTHPGGTVNVRIRATADAATLDVEDECGGLPPGKVEELFTPFVQRGADRSGFGLGLAITKDAIEAHHGSVQVSNLPGKGCIFMMSIPLRGR
jgi:signal transduction histidine kinase